MIRGFATPDKTEALIHRHGAIASSVLGRSGLACARAGFGGYRIGTSAPEHREALGLALRRGINLIDTSANYADGQSEILVGQVLATLIEDGEISREAVIVVTKAGYLQGQNYALSQKRKQDGHPFPELVDYADGLEHCIHPEFLEDQITRSLERLNLACIDVLLLHNPEYYLSWAARQGVERQAARKTYDERIRRAFAHLEKEVDHGRIRFYGISSNTLPEASDSSEFTSLSRVLACADEVKSDHHLAVIQFPMNLFESGAVLEANQPDGRTLLETARQSGLGTLVNRPLNAFTGNRLIRLADIPDLEPLPPETIRARLQDLAASETLFFKDILPDLELDSKVAAQITQQLAMAESLASHFDRYESYDSWQQIMSDHILPRAGGVIAYLGQKTPDEAVFSWSADYRHHLNAVLAAVSAYHAPKAAAQVEMFKDAVRKADEDWDTDDSLSRMAIRALHTTQGISAVLVGMRRPDYVQDTLAALTPGVAAEDRTASWMKLKTRLTAEL